MNAPHLGTAANAHAVSAGKTSLSDFLLDNSTNPAGGTDFKTIAASFFANTAATVPPKPDTASSTASKSKGLSGQDRDTRKDSRIHDPEIGLTFLPSIPPHLLNIPVPMYQVASSPQESGPMHVADMQDDLTISTDNPSQLPKQFVQAEALSTAQSFFSQPNRANLDSDSPADAASEESSPDAIKSLKKAETQLSSPIAVSTSKISSPAAKVSDLAQKPGQFEISPRVDKSVADHTTKQVTTTPHVEAAKGARRSETTDPFQDAVSTQVLQPDNSTPKSELAVDAIQVPQPPPTISLPVNAMVPTAATEPSAANNKVIADPAAPSTDVQSGAAQTQPVTSTPLSASTNETDKRAAAINFVPNTTVSQKAPGKPRAEAAKSKTGHENVDSSSEATTTNELRQHELHAINAPQATANTSTNKNQDAAILLVSTAPHTKSILAHDKPETLPLASPNVQAHDIDDASPATGHSSINAAKLVQGLSESELRVGLQTRDFGNIDIRTSVSRHEFSAQISVERNDVAHTLTTELPGLYARLNEHQVSVSNIHIHNQSLSTSSGLDQQQSQQSPARQQSSGGTMNSNFEPTLPVLPEMFNVTDRLDIRI